jgi:FlaA1/EpsC-like NDP-sugar epimerase
MKTIIKTIAFGAFIIGTTATINVQAKPLEVKENHVHTLDAKATQKVKSTVSSMAKDLGLDEKQTSKIQDIKMHEAQQIESVRMDKDKSQNDITNQTIFITNDTHSKVEKVLDKDQIATYNSKKSSYDYNPGVIENIKDKYNEKKEDIQERREEKK